MFLTLLLLMLGLAGLVLGGDFLVRGAVNVAHSLNVSPMIIGLTLVGFGTSTPELVTSIQAALSGSSEIAIGNVVGSNIGNVLLILGLVALIAPVQINWAALRRDGTVLVLITLGCAAAVLYGHLGRITGAMLMAALAVYLILAIMSERRGNQPATSEMYAAEGELRNNSKLGLAGSVGLATLGLALVIAGARLFVDGAVGVAQMVGLSETVIGLTIVALGTSAPEFVTSLIAARKGQGDVAFGNIIGSNIFNILGILGITSILLPMDIPESIIRFDICVLLASTLLLAIVARSDLKISQREGAVMGVLYLAYLAALISGLTP